MLIDINKKLAGLLVPAFALRTKDDLGIGDTKAVKEAIDFCHDHYFGVLQLLPINETGGDNSPYNAISSMALDPVYIHMLPQADSLAPGMVPGLTQQHLDEIGQSEKTADAQDSVINYVQVKTSKNSLLQKAFAQFQSGQGQNFQKLKQEFEKFQIDNKNWLADYTIFRSILGRKEGNSKWTDWEEDFRTVSAARAWLNGADQQIKQTCRFYAYVQWVAHRQWADVKDYAQGQDVRLIGDIPFGVSRYSADVWANPNLFDLAWCGGAPPERFFQADKFTANWGQNWGIPLYDWPADEKENYAWWRSRVQQVTKYFHGFRIDHVLGFFRIYAFPWLPERNNQFTDLSLPEAALITDGRLPQFMLRDDSSPELALQNCEEGVSRLKIIIEAAGEAIVVAEDLGLVPNYVRPALKKLGIPGFAIPIFERDEKDRSFTAKEKLPVLSLATYGTHDNEPLVSYYEKLVQWWHSDDGDQGWLEIQRLMHFLSLDENSPPDAFTEQLAYAFFGALLSTPCWLAVFMITDLLGSKQRFNHPGTNSDSNWSQRLDKSLAEYVEEKPFAEKLAYLRQLIVTSKRQPYSLNKSHSNAAYSPNCIMLNRLLN